jgi:hypothetical protein
MIALWHKVRRASPRERALAAEALGVLVAARVAVWLLPFATARRWLEAYARHSPAAPRTAERVAWAVAAAARRLPAPFRDCLPLALAALTILRRHRAPAELVIGARPAPTGGRIEAHAWVVSGERVVVGWLDDLPSFVPLAASPP